MNHQTDEKQTFSDDEIVSHFSHQASGSTSTTPVSPPRDMDVICGRGKSVSHPGNQRFRRMILARKEEYLQATRRDEKTRITQELVDALSSGPEASRFLLKDTKSGSWFNAGEVYAREKVSHALRSRPNEERRRKYRPKKKMPRIPQVPPELEGRVQTLIRDQQLLLKSMIEEEVYPGGAQSGILRINDAMI